MIEIKEIPHKAKCIISLVRSNPPQSRTIFYQCMIDPSKVSPSQHFIRFGHSSEDEVNGWIPLEDITIHEILSQQNADGVFIEQQQFQHVKGERNILTR